METLVWHSGKNNYRKHTFTKNFYANQRHNFVTELLDVEMCEYESIHHIFYDDLQKKQTKTVEVLYSGGMDSEIVLRSCLINKIPVRALTGKFVCDGYALNTHDLYYAEKFCRQNNIEQKIIEIDVKKFYENGEHIKLLTPYNVYLAHVAVHFHIFQQSTGFPVLGGEYSWPQHKSNIISPHRLPAIIYDKFLQDNGISGIGCMLSHSIEANCLFIKNHLEIMNSKDDNYYRGGSHEKIGIFKKDLHKHLGFGDLELRIKNYGWDMVPSKIFNLHKYSDSLYEIVGSTKEYIIWNQQIASALNNLPGSNYKY